MATSRTELDRQFALMQELERESEQVQIEIDRLMAEMESVPAERRDPALWGPSGNLTRLFIELSDRQNDLAEEIKRIGREIERTAPSSDAPKTNR
jgi:hypothetical protein